MKNGFRKEVIMYNDRIMPFFEVYKPLDLEIKHPFTELQYQGNLEIELEGYYFQKNSDY